ncbi:hypothetical protein E2C01_057302 [Portunus trituberculatus]|uniref:Uncharacterized protein n=1 Tax=Portunus trituberculatus TaxID=210409 RepID=A0A5B7H204_PORTR|nr:hypothetical protein [Portunus trituberculatus]
MNYSTAPFRPASNTFPFPNEAVSAVRGQDPRARWECGVLEFVPKRGMAAGPWGRSPPEEDLSKEKSCLVRTGLGRCGVGLWLLWGRRLEGEVKGEKGEEAVKVTEDTTLLGT